MARILIDAKGETQQIWFRSLASLAAVLSDENRRLPRLIYEKPPKLLTELAEFSRRKVSNVSHISRLMAGYGLASLQLNVREVQPTVLAVEFLVASD